MLQNITADDISWIKSKNLLSSTTGKSYYKQRMENLTSKRKGGKKMTISPSTVVTISRIKSLILELPGPILLPVIISRWKGYLLSNNMFRGGSETALVQSMKTPMTAQEKTLFWNRCWTRQIPHKAGTVGKGCAQPPLLPHLHGHLVSSLLDPLGNTCTYSRSSSHDSYSLTSWLERFIHGLWTALDLILCNLSE